MLHDVGQAIGHPGAGRLAVAARAAGLLIIGLDALGQIEMRDEAHVRLVDAHAERDGGDLSLIHISEPTRQAEISYAVFCLKKKKKKKNNKKKKKKKLHNT